MKAHPGGLPPLTQRVLVAHLKKKGHSSELTQVAIRVIIETMAMALTQGNPIIFRGFGSLRVRRYQSATKRLGLIFRPSRKLVARLNREK